MKYHTLKYLLIAILFCCAQTLTYAQYEFLKLQEGVRYIKQTEHSGKEGAVSAKPKSEKYYDEQGRLTRLQYRADNYSTYTYPDEQTVVEDNVMNNYTTTYTISKNNQRTEIRLKRTPRAEGETVFVNSPPEPMISTVTVDCDSLFQDIPRSKPAKEGLDHILIIDEFEDGSRQLLAYFKHMRYGTMILNRITTYTPLENNEGLSVKRSYYAKRKNAYLTRQLIENEYGHRVQSLKDYPFYRPTGEELAPRYEYELDEKGNWIKQTNVKMEEGKVWYMEQQIQYY